MFEAILVYKVSSRTARATQRNPVQKPTKFLSHSSDTDLFMIEELLFICLVG